MGPTILHKDQEFFLKNQNSILWKHRRKVMALFMMVSDLICLSASIIFAILFWSRVNPELIISMYQSLIFPVSVLFIFVYLFLGLYPGIGVGPVEELRRLTLGSSFGMLGLMGLSFYMRSVTSWSRAVFGLTWIFLLISVPLSRKVFRRLAVYIGLWGVPVVVVGENEGAESVYTSLRKNRLIGLWPVLNIRAAPISAVFPLPSKKSQPEWVGKELFKYIEIAVIVPQKSPLGAVKSVLLDRSHQFKRVIVIFDESRIGSVWFTPLHLVEHLGLEVTHQLINPTQQFIKRLIDISSIIICIPILLPLFAFIGLAIKLDSPGPVFYTQKRVGHLGKEISIWKFRSMVLNAEHVLNSYLESDPRMQDEWKRNFKLRKDPRVTRIGRLLRRLSFDELPQLWNVLRGEMSLIGPRPLLENEIETYGDDFEIYKQVLPGLTGLWQVSGRSNTLFSERVSLDVYYVQNWSIWLDIHIFLHTLITAVQARGAY